MGQELRFARGFAMIAGMGPPTPEGEAITADGLEVLRAELEDLETGGRQAMAERINAARQLGDLKENADYHIAKEDQAHLETKIQRLRQRLRNAVVVEADASGATIAFGRTAEVIDEESGQVHTWTIVGATEADLAEGKLSAESPVAQALLGRAPGDAVAVETPRGTRNYRVERLIR
jgi:transcription elongation factor GreA